MSFDSTSTALCWNNLKTLNRTRGFAPEESLNTKMTSKYSMNKFIKTTMLVGASLTLGSAAARAQYVNNDILVGFTSGTASSDYVIDIGQAFIGTTSQSDVSSFFNSSTFNSIFTGGNVGVNVGAIGGLNTGSTGSDVFNTQLRTGNNALGSVGTETVNPKPSPASTISSAAAIPPGLTQGQVTKSDLGSWTQKVAQDANTAGAAAQNWTGLLGNQNPMSQMGSSTISLDLFESIRTGSLTAGNWTFAGTLSFDFSNPSAMKVTFDPVGEVAVPEPSTYGLLAGGGLLLVALRRRLLAKPC
jgi:hypothetical protein